MSKTVIVGTTSSGKTCYFYGMLNRMMRGYQGFSIRVAEQDFSQLRRGIKRLGDTKLPVNERFPEPSSKQEVYDMDLLYNLKKIDTFQWVDYPGELAEEFSEDFIKILECATCLLLCVDGQAIQGNVSDIETIIDTIYNERGGIDLCNALSQAERKYDGVLPPVCIMITKYDEVSPELRNMETLVKIIQESFPILFHKGSGTHRMVTICPVTLGKDIATGGKLAPKNVEKPICFANYLIQTSILEQLAKEADTYMKKQKQAIVEYQKRSWLGKMFSRKPEPITEEQRQAVAELIANGKSDIDALRSVIESLPLYINGEQSEWL